MFVFILFECCFDNFASAKLSGNEDSEMAAEKLTSKQRGEHAGIRHHGLCACTCIMLARAIRL